VWLLSHALIKKPLPLYYRLTRSGSQTLEMVQTINRFQNAAVITSPLGHPLFDVFEDSSFQPLEVVFSLLTPP
jgi:alpha-amylase/alpha-mannosidase (GH57 family)